MSVTGSGSTNRAVGEKLQEFALKFAGAWADRPLEPAEIVDFAADAVPHTFGAGLTIVRGEQPPRTLAASSELAARIDEIEYQTGQGPCLDAIGDDDLTSVANLASDCRWPEFRRRAISETPVRSMFGVRVFLGGTDRGALNFYAREPDAFTELDLGIGAVLSTVSCLALQNAIERRKTVNLEVALESSRQIGMAMGVLMSSRLLTADQAFDQLRRVSQLGHRKLRDVAFEVTQTGVLPDPPRPPSRSSRPATAP
jgi:hypothetical protein